nr:Ankyrin repeat, PH and SEC7 domain containing protein [Ipomoea batatas]GME15467.1 Ankyrin repeat, PH and SEC7 domain containing protein [Ipomoea batatas]
MNKDPKFQERWEFRRRDDEFNSSSDDSKSSSSCGARRMKQNLLPRIILSQCVESNDDLRPQERNLLDSNSDVNFRCMEATEKQPSNRCKAIKNVKRRDPVKHSPKKQKSSAMESALWDDLKTFRESVVGELKVARETMFTQMKDDMTKLNPQKPASMPRRKVQNTVKRQSKNKSEPCRRNRNHSCKPGVRSLEKKMDLDSTNCPTICIEQVSRDQALKGVAPYKDNGNRSVISLKKPICLVNDSEHSVSAASYPPLPTVLTKALVENLNNMVPSRDQIQPTVITTDKDSIIQNESLGINANNHIGYILGSQEEEPSGSFTQINSKSLCLYDQSSMKMAFQVPPLHMLYNTSNVSSQAIPENTLQGNNRLVLGTTNSGTLSFSGGNLALAECFISNSVGYRRNRGLVSFRCQNYKENHLLQNSLEKD